jgi:hypothetical protein
VTSRKPVMTNSPTSLHQRLNALYGPPDPVFVDSHSNAQDLPEAPVPARGPPLRPHFKGDFKKR